MTQRQAIITFDPERIAQLDLQAEAHDLAWKLKQALLGNDYAPGRGIVDIELVGEGAGVFIQPARLDGAA